MVVSAQLTAEAANQLREGIDLLLGRWSALQMAIQNEWGGRDRKLNSLLLMSINGLSDLLTSGGGGDSGVHDNPMARGEGNG